MDYEYPNIAVVGYPNSGKTVLLSVLTGQKHYEAMSNNTQIFSENLKMLQSGLWPEATTVEGKKSDLIWQISKNNCRRIIKTRDFAGETWDTFIKNYGDYGSSIPNETDKPIADFLSSAAAIAVCVDSQAIFDDNDTAHKWIVRAIRNFMNANNIAISRMAVILTKYDQVNDLVEARGGLDEAVTEIFGEETANALRGKFFPIAAVNKVIYSHDQGQILPVGDFTSEGLGPLEDWLCASIEKALTAKFFADYYLVLVGMFLLLLAIIFYYVPYIQYIGMLGIVIIIIRMIYKNVKMEIK